MYWIPHKLYMQLLLQLMKSCYYGIGSVKIHEHQTGLNALESFCLPNCRPIKSDILSSVMSILPFTFYYLHYRIVISR